MDKLNELVVTCRIEGIGVCPQTFARIDGVAIADEIRVRKNMPGVIKRAR